MKKIFTLLIWIVFSLTILNAQEAPPQAFSYKATIINTKNEAIVASKTVRLRISILQSSTNGFTVYSETFNPTTNVYGQVDIVIGRGTVVSGNFSDIPWSNNTYFLKTEVDIKGGSDYQLMSIAQLLSIPYALYAGKAGSAINEYDPVFSGHPAKGITTGNISNWNAAYGWGNHALVGYALSNNFYSKLDLQTEGKSLIHWNNLTNKPVFAAVATTGNYTDLINFPIIPTSLNQISPDAGNRIISNVASPINAQDAVPKAYVDYSKDRISALEKMLGLSEVSDVDGNVYKTVKIGDQWWMAENLKTTKYQNGDLIGTTTPTTLDITGESTPKYQWSYYGNESNVSTYGRLYTWYAATDTRNLCPTGWHIPTDAEWTILTDYLGADAGGKLKEIGTTHWYSPNTGATNETGFTALPGGERSIYQSFVTIGEEGFWWSSTESDAENAWIRFMYRNFTVVDRYIGFKKYCGFSVRCVKTETSGSTSPVLNTPGANSGDMQYWNGTGWVVVPVGQPGQFLQLTNSSIPAWSGTPYPGLTTSAASLITANSATSGGNVTSDGGVNVTSRGVCWSTSTNPTILNNKTADGSGIGSFISSITGLTASTTYYIRSFATNSAGTGYGIEMSFTTASATLPMLTTSEVSIINGTSASSGGNVTSNGGTNVTSRGVCWSTSSNPTIANSNTTNGIGTGAFASSMTGLTLNTIYYIRAYATNSIGTAYGNEVSFKTGIGLIGDGYQGGIIAYFLQPGDIGYDVNVSHGLIAAPTDLYVAPDFAFRWCLIYGMTRARGIEIGKGSENTNTIINEQGNGHFAAALCYNLVLGGYSDWFLPSKDELNILLINSAAIGGFSFNNMAYWSSSEAWPEASYAWAQTLVDLRPFPADKIQQFYVRAIRYF